MQRPLGRGWGVLLLALACAGAVHAQSAQDAVDGNVIDSHTFVNGHPDLKWRRDAMALYDAGRHQEALVLFQRAARFADKPSQAIVSEMYLKGQGVPADPVLAYVWMDLAGERGYPKLIARREALWAGLDQAQRRRAVEQGGALYREYGDPTARPRLQGELRRVAAQSTGSRLGQAGATQIYVRGGHAEHPVGSGEQFYDPRYWGGDGYFEWQAQQDLALLDGGVSVGAPQPVRAQE